MIGTIVRHDPVGAEKAAADAESQGAPVISITCTAAGMWYIFVRVSTLLIRRKLESATGMLSISRGCDEDSTWDT